MRGSSADFRYTDDARLGFAIPRTLIHHAEFRGADLIVTVGQPPDTIAIEFNVKGLGKGKRKSSLKDLGFPPAT